MGSAPLAVGVSLGGGFPWRSGISRCTRVSPARTIPSWRGSTGSVPRSRWITGDDNFRVVLQLIKAAVCQYVPRGHTGDLGSPAVRHTRLNGAHMCDVVLQNINKRSLPIMLDC